MIHKAWCSTEEVPYYFSRSSIEFLGHTGWKIDDLDQIWARLLGRSQLSNPSDLPCWWEYDPKIFLELFFLGKTLYYILDLIQLHFLANFQEDLPYSFWKKLKKPPKNMIFGNSMYRPKEIVCQQWRGESSIPISWPLWTENRAQLFLFLSYKLFNLLSFCSAWHGLYIYVYSFPVS